MHKSISQLLHKRISQSGQGTHPGRGELHMLLGVWVGLAACGVWGSKVSARYNRGGLGAFQV